MTLLVKKVAGLACVLLGGLTIAHAAAAGRTWEMLVGLLVVVVGVVLLAMKIVRRNIPRSDRPSDSSGRRTT